ncbi:VanZ family protein [Halobellus inordinatus]|uniref:VanZ family protein n=1 Tax=Halobellus inordinatus TaxID=1126236 RepID=UPI0021149CB9|nr:VanZ family protein [Halobellus ramosii]
MTDADDRGREHPSRSRRRAGSVAAAWTLIVVLASVVDPAAILGPAAGGAPAQSTGTAGAVGMDVYTVAHLVAYGVLAWLVGVWFDSGSADSNAVRTALVAVGVAAAVGFGVEVLQIPVAARAGSTADAVVNVVGAVTGVTTRATVRTVILSDRSS